MTLEVPFFNAFTVHKHCIVGQQPLGLWERLLLLPIRNRSPIFSNEAQCACADLLA